MSFGFASTPMGSWLWTITAGKFYCSSFLEFFMVIFLSVKCPSVTCSCTFFTLDSIQSLILFLYVLNNAVLCYHYHYIIQSHHSDLDPLALSLGTHDVRP